MKTDGEQGKERLLTLEGCCFSGEVPKGSQLGRECS